MNTQLFARLYGIVFVIVGIGGFIPGLTQPHEHPGLIVNGSSGMELGLFPVNVLHNAVHILFGVWGLVAVRSHVRGFECAASRKMLAALPLEYGKQRSPDGETRDTYNK